MYLHFLNNLYGFPMIKYFSAIIIALTFSTITKAQVLEKDSLALVDFYNSMNGSSWGIFRWNLKTPVSGWWGIGVLNGRVKTIDLSNIPNLSGSVPESFGNLDSLASFYSSDANIMSLPASVTNLKRLVSFGSKNAYKGPLSSIINIPNLDALELSYYYSSPGVIPQAFENFNKLSYLNLAQNHFIGTIPSFFNNFNNLQILTLGSLDNPEGLFGGLENIPTQKLTSLYIQGNSFNFNVIEKLVKQNTLLYFNYDTQRAIDLVTLNGRLAAPAGGTVTNNTYQWYKDDTLLVATIVGDSTFQPEAPGTYHAVINNSIATQLTLTSNKMAAPSVVLKFCLSEPAFNIASTITGATYQWQQSIDSISYTDIVNDTNFEGANTSTLTLKNIPSSWYGRRYRCLTDNGNSIFYTLTFLNSWTGAANTNWNNSSNWSCGNIPDANTDVVIQSGTVTVSSDVTVRSLTVKPGANVIVTPGVQVIVSN